MVIRKQKISVIIPCYNEEKTIGLVLKEIPSFISEIIVVDNNSTDKGPLIAENYSNVRIVQEVIQGYGSAIKKGILESSGDIIAIIDGDNQHYVSDMISLADHLIDNNLDFVWGSRFPASKNQMSLNRSFGNLIQCLFFNALFGVHIKDSQSGMMIFNKNKVLEKINISKLSNGMSFSEDIKARVIFSRLKWQEKKINIKKRRNGPSKLRPFSDGVKNILHMFFIFYDLRIRKNH
jgi:glycosyltransferase involved in cell wall biosynthesis